MTLLDKILKFTLLNCLGNVTGSNKQDGPKEILVLNKLKRKTNLLKADVYALYLAARDPRTPWQFKLFVAGLAAYALSPVDIIPDVIPVLGYLDDFILLPVGIALAIRMIPRHVFADCRIRAQNSINGPRPVSKVAGAVIISIWLLLIVFCLIWIKEFLATKL